MPTETNTNCKSSWRNSQNDRSLHRSHCLVTAAPSMLLHPRTWGQFGEGLPPASVSRQCGDSLAVVRGRFADRRSGASLQNGYNAFANVLYNQGDFSAGIRYESYLNAVIGFPGRFKGTGLGYRLRATRTTTGHRCHRGQLLRSIWKWPHLPRLRERNLGIDNAMDGFRVILKPVDGIQAKFMYGKQRFDFDGELINGPGVVRAVDVQADLNDVFDAWSDRPLKVNLSGSFVSKFQAGSSFNVDSLVLAMPQNIGAWSYRLNAIRKRWSASVSTLAKSTTPARTTISPSATAKVFRHTWVQPKGTRRVADGENGRQHEFPFRPRLAPV